MDERMKSEDLPVGWPWRFLMFTVLIAVTVGVGCVGLTFGYEPLLESRLAGQEKALKDLGKIIPVKQQDEFVRFYSQLANLGTLLSSHVTASPLFGVLESRTNGSVSYAAMELRVPERKIVLEGSAANYQRFAEQLQSFTEAAEVESVIVNDSNALEGKVKFRITVTLREDIFK
ncbi:MAG: hypothetical protein EXS60_02085 [Candidatus Pacebacteria bacterium]|nr:hypothetical protein [Candidatus Paceibacterota bacterium]